MNDQTPVRTRSRIATAARPSTPSNTAPAGDGDTSWMDNSADGYERAQAEKARQQEERARRIQMPQRFKLQKVGDQADIIILDHVLPAKFYEHERFLASAPKGQKMVWEPCPGDWDHCPLCEGVGGFNARYYVQIFTILDLTPYTIKNGPRAGTVLPVTKKLLPVKLEGMGFFKRQFERHGSLRGVHLLMTRDSATGQKIGMPEFIAQYSDEDLIAEYGHEEQKNQQGMVIKKANEILDVCDYGRLFPKPSGEDLRARYGGTAPAGSAADNQSEWGQHNPGQTQAPAGRPAAASGGGIQRRSGTTPAPVNQPQAGQTDDMDDDNTDPDDVPLD